MLVFPESLQTIFANPIDTIRKYAFAEHNWHDYEAHGRSVRDHRFPCLCNNRLYLAWQGPAVSVRSISHQQLTSAQADIFLRSPPTEQLYQYQQDKHQLNNLAADLKYVNLKQELNRLLDLWTDETGNSVPEQLSE